MTISDTKLAGWRTLSDWMWQPQVSFAVLFIMKSRCRQHVHDIKKKTDHFNLCAIIRVFKNDRKWRNQGEVGAAPPKGLPGLHQSSSEVNLLPCILSPPNLLCIGAMKDGQLGRRHVPVIYTSDRRHVCAALLRQKISNPHQKKALSHGGWKLCCWHDNVQYVCMPSASGLQRFVHHILMSQGLFVFFLKHIILLM